MIYKIFPVKDTFIGNRKVRSVRQSGSNYGASEVLELYKISGLSGNSGLAGESDKARILLQFDLSQFANLTASGVAPSTGSEFYLKLYNAPHADSIPGNSRTNIIEGFSVDILPLSKSWDEGSGTDNDFHLDKGWANWNQNTSLDTWVVTGSDFLTTITGSYRFVTGFEDLELNISNVVNAWLTGGQENYGFLVKLKNNHEDDDNNYFTKKFFSRHSKFLDKRPSLEMRWDDSVKDQRAVFLFDCSSSLYLYNKKRGQLADIENITNGQNVIDVMISDASGTLMTVSASHVGMTGIYSASVYLATGSYSGSVFNDKWGVNGRTFMTGVFYPHNDGAETSIDPQVYEVKILNLKRQYESDVNVRLNLFVKTKTYNPTVIQTASLVVNNTIIEKGYYVIENEYTKQRIIPLGTGSVETTRLSYDENGNYFKFYTNSLSKNELYKIIFFFDVDGQLQKIDKNFTFKVL